MKFIIYLIYVIKEYFSDKKIDLLKRKEPIENQIIYIITINGSIIETKYNMSKHKPYYDWGNLFLEKEHALLKSVKIGKYLRSDIDYDLQLSLIKRKLISFKVKDKNIQKEINDLLNLANL